MIAVDARGRLGNQLFQYAFGAAAAHLLGTEFVFDTRGLENLFRLGAHVRPNRFRDAFMIRGRREIVSDDRDDPGDVLDSLADRTRYGGFFYSHEYFAPAIDVVRAAYRHREEVVRDFHAAHGPLVENGYVCLHVRLTDFRTYRGGIVLPPSYYMSALDTIGTQLPIVVISDDIDTVRRCFADLPRVSFESNDEATDFQLLRHASVVVTSNSSFAWWGAWLNQRAQRILAPTGWLTPGALDDFPEKAVPPTWERVPVEAVQGDSWPFCDPT